MGHFYDTTKHGTARHTSAVKVKCSMLATKWKQRSSGDRIAAAAAIRYALLRRQRSFLKSITRREFRRGVRSIEGFFPSHSSASQQRLRILMEQLLPRLRATIQNSVQHWFTIYSFTTLKTGILRYVILLKEQQRRSFIVHKYLIAQL